jgi:hypothetical protein
VAWPSVKQQVACPSVTCRWAGIFLHIKKALMSEALSGVEISQFLIKDNFLGRAKINREGFDGHIMPLFIGE